MDKIEIKRCCHKAIKNIIYEGITDVDLFNRPFEIDMLKDEKFQDVVVNDITKKIYCALMQKNINELRLHKLGHVLIPKKNLCDYRKCALIEINDEIIYLTLVLIIVNEIEKMRINRNEKIVFSYRYKYNTQTGRLFDKKYNYTAFRNEVYRKSNMKKNKVMVECDLSNFYDRLNIHRVESVLKSSGGINSDIIKILNEILLFWANRDSYGLPVGSNASRILAEVALIEVDNYLISKGIDFCRFVDDYRIFAKDAYTAHSNLACLAHCLGREGIFLNNQKTKIIDISKKQKKEKENDITSLDEKEDEKDQIEKQKDFFSGEFGKIIRGYSGLIPTKFRELSEHQRKNLEEKNLEDLYAEIKTNVIIKPEQATELIKTIVAQDKYEYFAKVPKILKKFPQFVPYFVDVAIKKAKILCTDDIKTIKEEFTQWFEEETPKYIQVYLVRLFSSDVFTDKNILLNQFRNLKRNSGDYIGRALLEALENKLNRGELLEIREYFYRADDWERRQIVHLLSAVLSKEENRPFYKDIKIYSGDLWLKYLIE